MASPTFAEIATQIKNLVGIYDALKTAGTTYLTNLDTYQQALEGDRAVKAASMEESTRSALAGLLSRGSAPISEHFLDWAKVIASSQSAPAALLNPVDGDLFQYFITNSQSVKERDITFGAISAGGSNVGTGVVKRLYTDRNSQDMEAVSLTAKKILCTADSNSGTKVSQELFAFLHSVTQTDGLDITALSSGISSAASGPENSLITNGSFEQLDGSAITSLSTVPGWTVITSIANLNYDATNYFATSPTERDSGNSYALKFLTNEKITQSLRAQGKTINPLLPYTFFLWYNRQVGSCDGTLTIRMGTTTASVVLAAQTGWNLLELTLNQTLWYSTFKEDDINLEIELSGRTTGTLLIDFVTFDVLKAFDGTFFIIQPGATPFRKGDVFTLTDSLTGAEGKIQYFLSRLFGVYAPHSGTPTIADPS